MREEAEKRGRNRGWWLIRVRKGEKKRGGIGGGGLFALCEPVKMDDEVKLGLN